MICVDSRVGTKPEAGKKISLKDITGPHNAVRSTERSAVRGLRKTVQGPFALSSRRIRLINVGVGAYPPGTSASLSD